MADAHSSPVSMLATLGPGKEAPNPQRRHQAGFPPPLCCPLYSAMAELRLLFEEVRSARPVFHENIIYYTNSVCSCSAATALLPLIRATSLAFTPPLPAPGLRCTFDSPSVSRHVFVRRFSVRFLPCCQDPLVVARLLVVGRQCLNDTIRGVSTPPSPPLFALSVPVRGSAMEQRNIVCLRSPLRGEQSRLLILS